MFGRAYNICLWALWKQYVGDAYYVKADFLLFVTVGDEKITSPIHYAFVELLHFNFIENNLFTCFRWCNSAAKRCFGSCDTESSRVWTFPFLSNQGEAS